MASTPLILTLTVLTATILVLLILWVFIRYTRERRTRRTQHRLQLDREAAYTAENGESSAHLHCIYQPSGAPHGPSHDVELQKVSRPKRSDDGDKAEVWLKRGASKDNLRAGDVREGGKRGVLGTKTVKIWGGEGNVGGSGLEGTGRVR